MHIYFELNSDFVFMKKPQQKFVQFIKTFLFMSAKVISSIHE